MKTTKRELKRIIAEEIKNVLKEAGDVPFDVDPKSGGKVDAFGADPLEMLKRVKAMVDKAIAEVEAAAGAPEKEAVEPTKAGGGTAHRRAMSKLGGPPVEVEAIK